MIKLDFQPLVDFANTMIAIIPILVFVLLILLVVRLFRKSNYQYYTKNTTTQNPNTNPNSRHGFTDKK